MQKKENRNYYIDFLRFVFSIVIVFYHSWIFAESWGKSYYNRGFYAVDFYFIVTGFLFINSLEKLISKNPKESVEVLNIKFVFNKVKQLIPNILFIFVIGYLLNYRSSALDYQNLFSDQTITEVLFSGFLGKDMVINSACWYISVMIVVLFLLFPIVYKYKKKYNYYICPLLIAITLGIVNYHEININNPLATSYIFINGFYKGIIFINLGVLAYELYGYLKQLELSKGKRIGVTVFETITYVALFLNTFYPIFNSYLTAILFVINVAITFSNISYTSLLFTSSKLQQLGKFGFILYLSNIPVRKLVLNSHLISYNRKLVLYWILVFVLSVMSYILSEVIIKRLQEKKKNKLA